MKKLFCLLLVSVLLFSMLVSCSGGSNNSDSEKKVTYIQLSQKNIVLSGIGASAALSYEIGPSYATDKSVAWKSSNENVAKCENGVVTSIGFGTCTVQAVSSSGLSSTCIVRVVNPNAVVALSVYEIKLAKPGEVYNLSASDENGVNITDSVVWSSSNSNVATCYGGKVTAKDYGICTVKAISKSGNEAVCVIRVEDPSDPTFTLNKSYISFDSIGETDLIKAESSNKNVSIEWTSTDESVAVCHYGKVTAVGEGFCVITATADNGLSASAVISVGEIEAPDGPPVDYAKFDVKGLPVIVNYLDGTGKLVVSAVITSYSVEYELDANNNLIIKPSLNGIKIYDYKGPDATTLFAVKYRIHSNEKNEAFRIDSAHVSGVKVNEKFSVPLVKFGIAEKEGDIREFYIVVADLAEE